MLLNKIHSPKDLKNFSGRQMNELAGEIREFLIDKISKNGGHLASNLGIVELTLALHRVFDTSKDKLIFDVGHQSYVHKILTGRKEDFDTLRQFEGLSGFPKRKESIHDCFDTGHSSTSISAGLGMAISRDLRKESYDVIAVIGDGALTGGLAFEALNHLGSTKTDMLVILNDNEMSICQNVGGLSNYLCKIRVGSRYRSAVKRIVDTVGSIPLIGKRTVTSAIELKNKVKHVFVPGAFFDEMGVKYFGPVDGHDYDSLVSALIELQKIKGPKLLHVLTEKGKGYGYAEENPSAYHGVGPFDKNLGVFPSKIRTYSDVVGDTLKDIFEEDDEAVVITAAMLTGTGIENLSHQYPRKVIDVGIAEAHAVTLSAGLAASGVKPYFAVYSTFLQRAYDQIVHDVCIQNLSVTFLIDRAGIVGEDGETHQGILDLSYLIPIPNMSIMAPKDADELIAMIHYSKKHTGPLAIRYPRGKAMTMHSEFPEQDLRKWEVMKKGKQGVLLAVGRMVETAIDIAEKLEKKGISIQVINARCVKPLDEAMLEEIMEVFDRVYTLEDNLIAGGFGSFVTKYLSDHNFKGEISNFGFPDQFIEHGKIDVLFEKYQLSAEQLTDRIQTDFFNISDLEGVQ